MRPALLIAAIVVALAPARAHAQAPAPEEPARKSTDPNAAAPASDDAPAHVPQLTKAPELLNFVQAPYPPEAEAQKVEGAVGLLVDIDEKGDVTKVEVTEPAGHGFDEAAIEAVKQFKFTPAEIDQKPAPVRIGYRYSFVLKKEAPPPEEKKPVVNFRGTALTRGNREVIANATVSVDEGVTGATTDSEGRFEVADVPAGKHKVVVLAPGFDRYETEEEFEPGKVTEVTYYVRKKLFTPYETVVKGKRERKDVARVELKQEEIRLIPGTQGDAFKVVENLPGVARAPYGIGLLIVRGGRPFDTRVYIDGVQVPLIFHFGGLTSVYNSDLLDEITFLPGNFSAHFGRATAGVVDGETRPLAKHKAHGYLNVSVLDTTLLLEAPVSDEISIGVSGRVSYIDRILPYVIPEEWGLNFIVAPRYYDYQLKLDYNPIGSRHKYRFQVFGSHDQAKLLLDNPALVDPEGRGTIGFTLGFHRAVATITSAFGQGLRNKLMLSAGYDGGTSAIGNDIGTTNDALILQGREALQYDWTRWLTTEVGIDMLGAFVTYSATAPNFPRPNEIPDPIASRQLKSETNFASPQEPGAYVEAIFKPTDRTRIIPGLRFDYESELKYFTVDPRLNLFQGLGDSTTLKAGVGIYQQPPDFRAGQWSPTFGNPDIGPEKAIQYMVGLEQAFTEAIKADVQLYYKDLRNQLQQSAALVERGGQLVPERWNNGARGRTYGVDLLLRHDLTKNFFGWIGYTLSRSERLDVFSRDGEWRTFAFDQPHNLVLVASYKWPRDWITGLRFRFSSGNPITPFVGSVYDADGDAHYPLPGKSFSDRSEPFLQLDARVDKRFVFDEWTVSAYLDVQNVTNHQNVENYIYNYDFSKRRILQGLPILPLVGVKAEF